MNMKIALIKSGLMDNYIESLLRICNEHGVQADVYRPGVDFSEIYNPRDFFSIFKANREIKEMLKDKNYDYILSDILPLSFGCNVFHNMSILKRVQLAPFFLYKLIFSIGHFHKILYAKNFFKKCPKTIVVSNVLKKDYNENCNIPENTFIVAHAGMKTDESNKSIKFKKLESNEPFVIGMNANGFVTKGGYVFLDALKALKKKCPDLNIKAKIIFPKYKKNKIIDLYVKFHGLSDVVEFLPYQKDIYGYYSSLNCFVCPSLLEAFGRVVAEAMNVKLPVIVSSDVGAADIIKDGVNGFVYEKDKNYVNNLADKILNVYQNYNELETLVEEGFKASCEITWENFSKEVFFGLYPELRT